MQFYRDSLLPVLEKLDMERKEILARDGIYLVVFAAACFLLWFIQKNQPGEKTMLLWLVLLAGGVIGFACVHQRGYGRYFAEYKSVVINNIIKFIDDGLAYRPDHFITEGEFKDANIFGQDPDRYDGCDYVSGTIGQTALRFSQIHAEYKTETTSRDSDDNEHTQEHWHTIFKGIFFIADFNKDFQTQTLVWPDASSFRFLKKRRSFFSGGWQVIKLEDPEFDRYFIVYGADQVEARYVLSTSLVRRILEFRLRADRDIYISFAGSQVYAGIPCATLFKPALFASAIDSKAVTQYFLWLSMVIGLVEDFGLNTRIWSKQPLP